MVDDVKNKPLFIRPDCDPQQQSCVEDAETALDIATGETRAPEEQKTVPTEPEIYKEKSSNELEFLRVNQCQSMPSVLAPRHQPKVDNSQKIEHLSIRLAKEGVALQMWLGTRDAIALVAPEESPEVTRSIDAVGSVAVGELSRIRAEEEARLAKIQPTISDAEGNCPAGEYDRSDYGGIECAPDPDTERPNPEYTALEAEITRIDDLLAGVHAGERSAFLKAADIIVRRKYSAWLGAASEYVAAKTDELMPEKGMGTAAYLVRQSFREKFRPAESLETDELHRIIPEMAEIDRHLSASILEGIVGFEKQMLVEMAHIAKKAAINADSIHGSLNLFGYMKDGTIPAHSPLGTFHAISGLLTRLGAVEKLLKEGKVKKAYKLFDEYTKSDEKQRVFDETRGNQEYLESISKIEYAEFLAEEVGKVIVAGAAANYGGALAALTRIGSVGKYVKYARLLAMGASFEETMRVMNGEMWDLGRSVFDNLGDHASGITSSTIMFGVLGASQRGFHGAVRKLGLDLPKAVMWLGSFGVEYKAFTAFEAGSIYLHDVWDAGELLNPLEAVAKSVLPGALLHRLFFLGALKAGGFLASPWTKPMHESARKMVEEHWRPLLEKHGDDTILIHSFGDFLPGALRDAAKQVWDGPRLFKPKTQASALGKPGGAEKVNLAVGDTQAKLMKGLEILELTAGLTNDEMRCIERETPAFKQRLMDVVNGFLKLQREGVVGQAEIDGVYKRAIYMGVKSEEIGMEGSPAVKEELRAEFVGKLLNSLRKSSSITSLSWDVEYIIRRGTDQEIREALQIIAERRLSTTLNPESVKALSSAVTRIVNATADYTMFDNFVGFVVRSGNERHLSPKWRFDAGFVTGRVDLLLGAYKELKSASLVNWAWGRIEKITKFRHGKYASAIRANFEKAVESYLSEFTERIKEARDLAIRYGDSANLAGTLRRIDELRAGIEGRLDLADFLGLDAKKAEAEYEKAISGARENYGVSVFVTGSSVDINAILSKAVPLNGELNASRDYEVFVMGLGKLPAGKYVGRITALKTPDGKAFYRFTEGASGKEVILDEMDVNAVSPRQLTPQEKVNISSYINVTHPQFTHGSFNVSLKGKRVVVDYTDKRLREFLDGKMGPIVDDLNAGRIDGRKAVFRAWKVVKDTVPYVENEFVKSKGVLNLGDFIEKGGVCNERGMILQVALQHLGIESVMEKGAFGDGRHAWVRVTGVEGTVLIADPQAKRLIGPVDSNFILYEGDSVDFDKSRMETVFRPVDQ